MALRLRPWVFVVYGRIRWAGRCGAGDWLQVGIRRLWSGGYVGGVGVAGHGRLVAVGIRYRVVPRWGCGDASVDKFWVCLLGGDVSTLTAAVEAAEDKADDEESCCACTASDAGFGACA